jgi:hypothetical protein
MIAACSRRTPSPAETSSRGPELLMMMRHRDLTKSQTAELKEIKIHCPCKNDPKSYKHNGENCELCGDFLD